MVLKRVGVLSAGKVCGALGLIVGLFIGGMMALLTLAGVALDAQAQGNQAPVPAMFVGVSAAIFLPIFYGVFSFISGIIYAVIYNVIAGMIGGLEMEFARPGQSLSAP